MRQEEQMKGSKCIVWYAMIGIAILAAWLIVSTLWFKNAHSEWMASAKADTLKVVIHDTVTVVNPTPIVTTTLPNIVARLPRWVAPSTVKMTGNQARDSVPTDSVCPVDSVDVIAPVEQKIYTDNVNYRAVISGAWVSLDTMEVYPRREVMTIRQPPDSRRWSIGVGVGYGMTPQGFQPWIGITASYTLFRF